jgi:hypothetical protein
MPLFSYDRSLPVGPNENINDVAAMLDQIRDFVAGGLGGDNLVPATITAREIGDEALDTDALTPQLARRLGVTRTGAQPRRQASVLSDVTFEGDPIFNGRLLAQHNHTAESANDVLFFGALLKNPTVVQDYVVDLFLDGASMAGLFTFAPVVVSLGEDGWGTESRGFAWHAAPFSSVGQERVLRLTCAAENDASWGLVAMYSMVLEIG